MARGGPPLGAQAGSGRGLGFGDAGDSRLQDGPVCKSFVKTVCRGERPIEPSSSRFPPKFPCVGPAGPARRSAWRMLRERAHAVPRASRLRASSVTIREQRCGSWAQTVETGRPHGGAGSRRRRLDGWRRTGRGLKYVAWQLRGRCCCCCCCC